MRHIGRWLVIVGVLSSLSLVTQTAVADEPAAGPDKKTGELDLTFTRRSPLSARKEIARRLTMPEAELGDDYDVATRPFKAYVPANYDPAVPHGVFVYLGYKDSESVAPTWEPLLDKAHLIFITPVCHHGEHFPNEVPLWQVMGLAFDAVENLKSAYNIDARRVYLMSFGLGAMRLSLGTADVFTGLIVTNDPEYCLKMPVNNTAYPPAFPPPPGPLFQQSKRRGIAILGNSFSEANQPPQLLVVTMKRDGFAHVIGQAVSNEEDVHYPNLKTEWFEQTVLPFLDKAAAGEPAPAKTAAAAPHPATAPIASRTPAPAPVATPAQPTPPPAPATGDPEAQRLLRLAKLSISNGQPALARPKLEAIVKTYPNDPAAATAKELLKKLPEN